MRGTQSSFCDCAFHEAAAARTRYRLVGSDGAAFNGFADTAAHGAGA